MKQVIAAKQPEQFVHLDSVSRSHFYGAKLGEGKGFLILESDLKYRVRSLHQINQKNYWCFEDSDLSAIIKDIICQQNGSVYEFNSAAELFKWILE